MNFQESESGK